MRAAANRVGVWAVGVAVFTLAVMVDEAAGQLWDGEQIQALRGPVPPDWVPIEASRGFYGISWRHWWAVNQYAWLNERAEQRGARGARRGRGAGGPADVAGRGRIVELLLEKTESEHADVRHAAAFALGRMQASEATERLIEMATDADEPPYVRLAAIVSLGVMDDETARDALVNPGQADETMTIAWLAASGLQEEVDDATLRVAVRLVRDGRSARVQRWAGWVLRHHAGPDALDFMRDLLVSTRNWGLGMEVVQYLGQYGDRDDRELLMQIVMEQQAGGRLPVMQRRRTGEPANTQMRRAATLALAASASDLDPEERRFLRDRLMPVMRMRAYEGQWYAQAHLTYAMGRIGTDRGLHQVKELNSPLTLEPDEPVRRPYARMYTVRGFAAIAMGERLAEFDEMAAPVDQFDDPGEPLLAPGRRDVLRMFDRALGSDNESLYYQLAVLLALGLSDTDAAVDLILANEDALWSRSDLVIGKATLALAMLGEPEAIGWAADYLRDDDVPSLLAGAPVEEHEWEGRQAPQMIARYNAVRAMSLMDDPDAFELLRREWGQNAYVSIEVARALRRTGQLDVAEQMLAVLEETEDIGLTQVTVWSLGELLEAPGTTPRLERLMGSPVLYSMGVRRAMREIHWRGADPTHSGPVNSHGPQKYASEYGIVPDVHRLVEPLYFDILLPLVQR